MEPDIPPNCCINIQISWGCTMHKEIIILWFCSIYCSQLGKAVLGTQVDGLLPDDLSVSWIQNEPCCYWLLPIQQKELIFPCLSIKIVSSAAPKCLSVLPSVLGDPKFSFTRELEQRHLFCTAVISTLVISRWFRVMIPKFLAYYGNGYRALNFKLISLSLAAAIPQLLSHPLEKHWTVVIGSYTSCACSFHRLCSDTEGQSSQLLVLGWGWELYKI